MRVQSVFGHSYRVLIGHIFLSLSLALCFTVGCSTPTSTSTSTSTSNSTSPAAQTQTQSQTQSQASSSSVSAANLSHSSVLAAVDKERARFLREQLHNPCVHLRIALDIGSGSSKARSGVVDTCHAQLIAQVSKASAPVGFKDHLARPQSDGKFTTEFMQQAIQTIVGLVHQVEGETERQLDLSSLSLTLEQFISTLPRAKVEIGGVATEAFRQAKNSSEFVELLAREKIKLQVISQVEEGRLGFAGVQALKSNIKRENIISWDIGGGSLQIVGYQPEQMFGNQLASQPARVFVMQEYLHKEPMSAEGKPLSPNPIISRLGISEGVGVGVGVEKKKAVTQNARKLFMSLDKWAKKQLAGLVSSTSWFKKALKKSRRGHMQGQSVRTQIYGIGGVHNGILAALRALPGYEKATGYTGRDLRALLEKLLILSDAELISQFHIDKKYVSVSVTNVLLVESAMRVLGIDDQHTRIEVLDVDNSLGTFLTEGYF